MIAVVGKFMCHLCLASLGFIDIKWTIDPVGQLPAGVEPGMSLHVLLSATVLVGWPSYAAAASDSTERAYLPAAAAIVSNHISYMDILVHLGHSFPSFVARGNTQDMPLLGLIRYLAARHTV